MIYIDLDGVVVDLFGKLNEFLRKGPFKDDRVSNLYASLIQSVEQPVDLNDRNTMEVFSFFEKVHKVNLFDLVYEYHDPYEFWSSLEPLNASNSLLWNTLISDFGVDNLCILSAATKQHSEECKRAKEDWVHQRFPFITNIIILDDRRDKGKYAKDDYRNVLIDDFPSIVEDWRAHGGTAVLWDNTPRAKAEVALLSNHLERLKACSNLTV